MSAQSKMLTMGALILAACGGSETNGPSVPPPAPPPPPQPAPTVGNVQVSVATTGADLDSDGYFVSIDGGALVSIGVNGFATLTPANTGSHSIALSGIAANCSVTGNNPRLATVSGASHVQVSFGISCAALVQSLSGKIVFESNRGGNYDVWVMNADGTSPVNLTNTPGYDYEPDWSPDGSKIVFVSRRDGNDEIYVMNANGSGQTRLTFNAAEDAGPEWSPDGTKIAFESERDGNGEVYVMNANGSGVTNLTRNSAYDKHPAWHPNGSKIAFQSDRIASKYLEVFVMNADGSGAVDVSNNNAWFDGRPAWSPDGSKLAFVSTRDTPAGAVDDNYEVYVMNANGSSPVRLTNHPELDSYPVWSPDGNYIAFRSDRVGNIEIFTMKADGTGLVNRTNNTATDCHPSWFTGAALTAFMAPQPPASFVKSDPRSLRTNPVSQRIREASACLGQ